MNDEKSVALDIKVLQDIFIGVLCSELNETELDGDIKASLTPKVMGALYSLSKHYDLAHIVSSALYKNGLITNAETKERFNREELMSVFRNEQMRYAYGQICTALDEASIPYIPLKGSVIRPYYPKESMRTSCDIDILIKEEELNAAVDLLVQKGFKCKTKNYHDVSLYSPNNIHLELHFNIQENIESLDAILKDAWSYATPTNGFCHEFSREFFLFHIFAHISYHFLSGGCGIRPLMDIWIMKHKMGITYQDAEELLTRAGIYKFAEEITRLSEIYFSGEERDDFTDVLQEYIFEGGIYGSLKNNIAMKEHKAHLTPRYIAKRIFVPFNTLKIEYPILKKCPLLYIFCWAMRTVKLFFNFIKNTFKRRTAAKSVSSAEVDKGRLLRSRLGL